MFKSIKLRLMVLIAASSTILWLSLTPSPPTVELPFWGWDKAQHALAYAGLTLAAGGFFQHWRRSGRRAWEWAVVYALGWGGLMEIMQKVSGTGRVCEWGDLLADLVGALGIYAAAWIYAPLSRRSRH